MIHGVLLLSMIHVDETLLFYAQILEANEVYYFFTSNDNLEQTEQQLFFQWIKNIALSKY